MAMDPRRDCIGVCCLALPIGEPDSVTIILDDDATAAGVDAGTDLARFAGLCIDPCSVLSAVFNVGVVSLGCVSGAVVSGCLA